MIKYSEIPLLVWCLTLIGVLVGLNATYSLIYDRGYLELVPIMDFFLGICAIGLLYRIVWLYWLYVLGIAIKVILAIGFVISIAFFSTYTTDQSTSMVLATFSALTVVWFIILLGLRSNSIKGWMTR